MSFIKQGDAYGLPMEITLDGAPIAIEDVAAVEVCIGHGIRKLYPEEITFDRDSRCFQIPLTQEETFSLPASEQIQVDVRVKFVGGAVIGSIAETYADVVDAMSEELL